MGKVILKEWDSLTFTAFGFGIAKFNHSYGIVNYDMEVLVPLIHRNLAIVIDKKKNKVTNWATTPKGLINYWTNEIIYNKCQVSLSPDYDVLHLSKTENNKWKRGCLTYDLKEYWGEEAEAYLKTLEKNWGRSKNLNLKKLRFEKIEEKYAIILENDTVITHAIFDILPCYREEDGSFVAKINNSYYLFNEKNEVLLRNKTFQDVFSKNNDLENINWNDIYTFDNLYIMIDI